MNYTENCHLPQWDGDDRVLRTDFNDAFAVLERIGTDHLRIRAVADGLVRDAYRREVQGRIFHGQGGMTDGMWINALNSREEAGGDGHGWNGRYGISAGCDLPTVEGIEATAKEEAYIATMPAYEHKNRWAGVTFVSDGYGMMETVGVWVAAPREGLEFPFTIQLTRLDTGELVGEKSFVSDNGVGYHKVSARRVDFPLEAGVPYRLYFALEDGETFTGRSGFRLATSQFTDKNPPMTITARPVEERVVKTVPVPVWAESAAAVMRWQGNSMPELLVNDIPLTAVKEREAVTALGDVCRETEYQLDALPEESLAFTLQIPQTEDELRIFDYGLIWQ